MARFLATADENMLALARAKYELALTGLSKVRGDELRADLKYGAASANESTLLLDAIADATLLLDRMRTAAATIELLERRYDAPNQELHVYDKTQALAFARVSRDWEVADSGRVSL